MHHSCEGQWQSFQCSLCLKETGQGEANVTIHLEKHLQDIALATLPNNGDDESDSSPPSPWASPHLTPEAISSPIPTQLSFLQPMLSYSDFDLSAETPSSHEPAFYPSNTFRNSHYNAAHWDNNNFQPEMYQPDAEDEVPSSRNTKTGASHHQKSDGDSLPTASRLESSFQTVEDNYKVTMTDQDISISLAQPSSAKSPPKSPQSPRIHQHGEFRGGVWLCKYIIIANAEMAIFAALR